MNFLSKIVTEYQTINKNVGGKKLWEAVTEEKQAPKESNQAAKRREKPQKEKRKGKSAFFKPKF
jgi:hypothetical protein